jgi:hypothetical protein
MEVPPFIHVALSGTGGRSSGLRQNDRAITNKKLFALADARRGEKKFGNENEPSRSLCLEKSEGKIRVTH